MPAAMNAASDTTHCGAYAHDLRTFARYADPYQITEPFLHDNILGYHRHLSDVIQANAATIERRLSTLRSDGAWREDQNSTLPSPFADVRISIKLVLCQKKSVRELAQQMISQILEGAR